MTAATNTTAGEIKLAGDLFPFGTRLIPSGVKEGIYPFVGKLHIDAKGRIIWAGDYVEHNLVLPTATKTVNGAVKPGTYFDITSVENSSENYTLLNANIPYAATGVLGKVKLGNNLTVGTDKIDATFPVSSDTQFGVVKPGVGFEMDGEVLQVAISELGIGIASNTVLGLVKDSTTNGLNVDVDGVLSADNTTDLVNNFGLIKLGAGFTATDGVLSANVASNYTHGLVKYTWNNFNDYDGKLNVHGWAGNLNYGYVQGYGTGVNIDNNGVITCAGSYSGIGTATANSLGYVKTGTLNISSGVLSMPIATGSTLGAIKVGTGLSVDGTGNLITAIATGSTLGVVKIGSRLSVDGTGNLTTAIATTSTLGAIKVGTGLSINSGTLYVPIATTSTYGCIKAHSDVNTQTNNTIANSRWEISNSVLSILPANFNFGLGPGIIKITEGNGLSVTPEGVLSYVNPTPLCDENTIGKIAGVNTQSLKIVNGVLTYDIATTSEAGIVKPNASIINNGVMNLQTVIDELVGINTNDFDIDNGVLNIIKDDFFDITIENEILNNSNLRHGNPYFITLDDLYLHYKQTSGNWSITNGAVYLPPGYKTFFIDLNDFENVEFPYFFDSQVYSNFITTGIGYGDYYLVIKGANFNTPPQFTNILNTVALSGGEFIKYSDINYTLINNYTLSGHTHLSLGGNQTLTTKEAYTTITQPTDPIWYWVLRLNRTSATNVDLKVVLTNKIW